MIFVLPSALQQKKSSQHALIVKTIHRVEMLSVKPYNKSSCNPLMMAVLVELFSSLAGLTSSAVFDGQKQSRTLTFYAPVQHEPLLTISLV